MPADPLTTAVSARICTHMNVGLLAGKLCVETLLTNYGFCDSALVVSHNRRIPL